jgi:hypothetical protein
MYERGDDLTEAARAVGQSPQTLARRLREYRKYKSDFRVKAVGDISIPDSPSPDYTDYADLEGDDWLVLGDLEIPDHDLNVSASRCSWRCNIRNLVLAGDLVATDQMVGISGQRPGAAKTTTEDITGADRQLFKHRSISVCCNHDDRIARKTGGESTWGCSCAAHRCGTALRHHLDTSRGLVWVVHRTTSQDPITSASSFTDTPKAIALGHCHRRQDG